VLYNFEYREKLKIAYIGAGEHSIRNILPTFQYAPIELVALADHNTERGLAVARMFGARRFYPNHKALLAKETELDAAMIVVGPDEEGRPRYPELAAETLTAGLHTWIDAPPCLSASQVSTFTNACIKRHKYLAVGFRRRFSPGYAKAAELLEQEALGRINSYSFRFPLRMPGPPERRTEEGMAPFLPFTSAMALLLNLFGEAEGVSYVRNERTGAAAMQMLHRNGVIGSLHLTVGQSTSSPQERLEIIGSGQSLAVDGGVRLEVYRVDGSQSPEQAGRQDSFVAGGLDDAQRFWEPRFDALEPATHHIALSGYLGSIKSFAERLLAGEPPKYGTLVDVLHVMTVLDRIRKGKEREWIII
jgi:predicted dehydrogenase